MTEQRTKQPIEGYEAVPRARTVYPRNNSEFADLDSLIDGFIVDKQIGRFFSKSSKIFTQGSCFAENLYNAIVEAGYCAYYNKVMEVTNSPIANLFYLRQLCNEPQSGAYRRLAEADVFILTIGVAPIWFKKATNGFVYQPNVKAIDEYYERMMTYAEARDSLQQVVQLVQQINPEVRLVLTLSPVPLGRTFEFHSAIVADCISKSMLRTAIHEVVGAGSDKLMYFPAFEVVRWAGSHRGDTYGEDGAPRHVSKSTVDRIVAAFVRHYSLDLAMGVPTIGIASSLIGKYV